MKHKQTVCYRDPDTFQSYKTIREYAYHVVFSFSKVYPLMRSQGSVVGIATGYGLDDRGV
jgi:hypothetical protein